MDELTQKGSDEIEDKSEDLAFYMAKMNNLEAKLAEEFWKFRSVLHKLDNQENEVWILKDKVKLLCYTSHGIWANLKDLNHEIDSLRKNL